MRGQAHTLEAVIAGLLLLSGLAFALQVTAVTPLSASTASQHIENQQQTTAEGVLATAEADGTLKRAVLFWGDPDGDGTHSFVGADEGRHYTSVAPPNGFGALLDRSMADRGIAYNVHVVFVDEDGRRDRQRMVYRGEPSDNAVRATTVVTLVDDDETHADPDGDGVAEPTGTTLASTSTFYAPDASPSGVYNVVVVEVTVWRQ